MKAFIGRVANEERRKDCEALVRLMKAATGRPPVMWGPSIVGFGRYQYRYESGRTGEWPAIGFSLRKTDLTLYLMPGFEKREPLMTKLGRHRTGKSRLYLKRLADVDRAVLKRLIDASVKAMASKRVV